jgi:regulator of replication initiation timing
VDNNRIELTEKELIAARMGANQLIRKIMMKNLPVAFSNLAVENVRLMKEVNHLRSQLGLPQMEEHKVA